MKHEFSMQNVSSTEAFFLSAFCYSKWSMKPILFLDFDRTLFDTDRFYEWLGPNRFDRLLEITGGVGVLPDFQTYLYADTIDFLRKSTHTHTLVLLTYAVNTILQEKKVRESGILSFFEDVLMTSGEGDQTGKGVFARDYIARRGASGWEHLFVDDAPQNIDEVKRMNPPVRCVRIDRLPFAQGMLHDGLLAPDTIVTDLLELEQIL